jgi:hypothetical protein
MLIFKHFTMTQQMMCYTVKKYIKQIMAERIYVFHYNCVQLLNVLQSSMIFCQKFYVLVNFQQDRFKFISLAVQDDLILKDLSLFCF